MLRLTIFCMFMLTLAHAAEAHKVSWINGKIYDYALLTKGKNCCDDLGRECRPAFSYTRVKGGWRLEIPVDGHNPYGARAQVVVLDDRVTDKDLAKDGVAHVCAKQSGDEWNVYCTFIPPGFVLLAPPADHSETLLTERFAFTQKQMVKCFECKRVPKDSPDERC